MINAKLSKEHTNIVLIIYNNRGLTASMSASERAKRNASVWKWETKVASMWEHYYIILVECKHKVETMMKSPCAWKHYYTNGLINFTLTKIMFLLYSVNVKSLYFIVFKIQDKWHYNHQIKVTHTIKSKLPSKSQFTKSI